MTVFVLKLIAFAAMLIDHADKIFHPFGLLYELTPFQVFLVRHIWSPVGRLAFPIFAYMVAEGTKKTWNIWKYIGRLALFALISEPFFSLALGHSGNVIITMTLGVLSVALYERLEERVHRRVAILPVAILIFIAEWRHIDYGGFGVALIFFLSLGRTKKQKLVIFFCLLTCFYLFLRSFQGGFTWGSFWSVYIVEWLWACVAVVLIGFYNGTKKRSGGKWLFYIGYPAHLAIFYGIKLLIG